MKPHNKLFVNRHSLFCAGLLSALLAVSCAGGKDRHAQPVYDTAKVNNLLPRYDVSGEIVDAHDGCLQYFAGRYYLYGTAYGKSAGYGINNRFRVYSSPDLMM